MRKFSLIIIAAVLAMLMLTGCVPEEAPPAADPTAQQALNIANTNTGSIQALAARVGTVEGRTAGEVTQAELDALAGQVTALSTKVTELETTIAEWDDTVAPDGTTTVASVTRWRPRFTFDADNITYFDDGDIEYTYEYEPRTIKEPDVYAFKITFSNPTGGDTTDIKLEDLVLNILLTPNDDVLVSDNTDAYQIAGPYNVYWNTDVRTSASSGVCRYIEIETDMFDLTVKEGKTITIELEFDLVYGA
jgi:outer membrane murein-binding lipoprotein Lpp